GFRPRHCRRGFSGEQGSKRIRTWATTIPFHDLRHVGAVHLFGPLRPRERLLQLSKGEHGREVQEGTSGGGDRYSFEVSDIVGFETQSPVHHDAGSPEGAA